MSAILPRNPTLSTERATAKDRNGSPRTWTWLRDRLKTPSLPFRDLSYRFKIPFSVSVVILVTTLIISVVIIAHSYRYLRQDLVTSAESLGRTLSRALLPIILRDEMWQAYEIVVTPFDANGEIDSGQKVIVVLDAHQHIYVSSHPRLFPTLQSLAAIDASHQALSDVVAKNQSKEPFLIEGVVPGHIVVGVPIVSDDGTRLGTLILQYAETLFLPRFWETVRQVAFSTLIVLVVLIPLGWYAGNRMVIPLLELSRALRRVGNDQPSKIGADLYVGGDEIGQLGRAFHGMLGELEEKQALEKQMIMSDRLASIGRLTAGIAHEINNPLGGMFNAINTFKHHGIADPVSARTLSLLERGLTQIKETVGALLVEARIESHALTREDVEDVQTLVAPEAGKKHLRIQWQSELKRTASLPSTPVRQVLINLLLNAIQAADERGHVRCRLMISEGFLRIHIENDGRPLSASQRAHLFEPFLGDAGGGLGLWVTYQIVQQLKGDIVVDCGPPLTRFEVRLPLQEQT
jgi:two-component system, NtrC family, sensor kinase